MKRLLIVTAVCFAVAPALAAPQGSMVVAQGSATGGVSGGPNQQQAIVPPNATGGKSGGPNQEQAVVPSGTTGGKSGGPNQEQAKQSKTKQAKAKTKQ